MTLDEKREIVSKNKDPAIAALNSVLDRIYDLQELSKKGKSVTKNDDEEYNKFLAFLDSISEDTKKYESVRLKLLKDDFNLSLVEINQVALAFHFCFENMRQQMTSMQKACEIISQIERDLMSPSIEVTKSES